LALAIAALAIAGGTLAVALTQIAGPAGPDPSADGSRPAATRSSATSGSAVAPAASLTRIAGPGCPQSDTQRYVAVATARTRYTGGAYATGSCNEDLEFLTSPEPGSTLASWLFNVGPGVSSCHIALYVPDNSDALDVATFRVTAGGSRDDQAIVIKNAAAHTWAPGGRYPVRGNSVKVDLLDTETGPGPHIHIATRIYLNCSGAPVS